MKATAINSIEAYPVNVEVDAGRGKIIIAVHVLADGTVKQFSNRRVGGK